MSHEASAAESEYFDLLALVGQGESGRPIAFDAERNAWLACSYGAVKEIASDPIHFIGAGVEPELAPPGFDREFYVWFEGGLMKFPFIAYLEPEVHRRLHRWWMQQFSPRQIEDWREHVIKPVVREAIDALVPRGRADLMADLARRVPLPLVLKMMDLPLDGDLATRYQSVAQVYGEYRHRLLSTPLDDALRNRATDLAREMRALLMPELIDRKGSAGDDLISRLWREAPQLYEREVTDEDFYANVATLFEAGIGTSIVALGNALWALIKWPTFQSQLRDDPAGIPNFVEEVLRLTSPALYLIRQVRKDLRFHGQLLRRGDMVFAFVIASNRDPARYECPHNIVLDRQAPRDHHAFGFGPRHCAGHAVARAQLQETVASVVTHLTNLQIDPHATGPRRAGAGSRRPWSSLNVTFEAA